MGWLGEFGGTHYKNGKIDRKAELDDQYTWERNGSSCKVLKSAMVGCVYYAALRITDGSVIAVITLTSGRNSRNDECAWYHKDMDESMEPYYYDCPKGILDMLTPTTDTRSLSWRQACRDRLAKKADERKNGKQPAVQVDGIELTERRGSYILSSPQYRRNSCYTGVRYAKRRFKSPFAAQRAFIWAHGTDEQKAAFTAITGDDFSPKA